MVRYSQLCIVTIHINVVEQCIEKYNLIRSYSLHVELLHALAYTSQYTYSARDDIIISVTGAWGKISLHKVEAKLI